MMTGIDISRWQGTIDWPVIKTDFCIIKAGGSDDGQYEDSKFRYNQSGVRSFNIPHGYYYFCGGGDPVAEAQHFYSLIGPLRDGEFVAMDYEIDHPDPKGYCQAFLTRCEELFRHIPVLYTNQGRCNLFDKPFTRYPLWVASYYYNNTPDHQVDTWPWTQWAIYQYTSMGIISGITANTVDLNVCDNFAILGLNATPTTQEADMPGYFRERIHLNDWTPKNDGTGVETIIWHDRVEAEGFHDWLLIVPATSQHVRITDAVTGDDMSGSSDYGPGSPSLYHAPAGYRGFLRIELKEPPLYAERNGTYSPSVG